MFLKRFLKEIKIPKVERQVAGSIDSRHRYALDVQLGAFQRDRQTVILRVLCSHHSSQISIGRKIIFLNFEYVIPLI